MDKERVVELEAVLDALRADGTAAPQGVDAVDGVPGAFVLRGAVPGATCDELAGVVRAAHGHDLARAGAGRGARRESQHHLHGRVRAESLAGLAARMAPWLPRKAGPDCACELLEGARGVSNFVRTYCYEEGDFSAPHFDRSFRVAEDGCLRTLTAYSVVLYLNDGFEGGCTTFFKHDPSIVKSRNGNTPVICDPAQLEVAARVAPRKGDALVFPHGNYPGCHPDPLHEGSVVERGHKCIIRTDLVFRFVHRHGGDAGAGAASSGAAGSTKADKRRAQLAPEQLKTKEAVEAAFRASLDAVCPSESALADDCVRFAEGHFGAEMHTGVAATLFWKLFREQRKPAEPEAERQGRVANGAVSRAKKDKNKGSRRQRRARKTAGGTQTVNVVSDFGLVRALTLPELAAALLEHLPGADKLLAHTQIDAAKGHIHLTSQRYALLQASRGLIACERCGRFVKRHNGGLEWHLKTAHGVDSHEQAFDAVKRTSTALVQRQGGVAGTDGPSARVLDPEDMALAMRDKSLLQASLEQGKIKSLGPFLDACRMGDLAQVRALLATGVDPAAELDRNGSSGLLWAAGFGNLELCKLLVEEGGMQPEQHSQVARRGYSQRHALHWAARNGHLPVLRWLTEELSFPVDKPSSDGTTALCLAAWQGHLEAVRFLVERGGADPKTVNSYGCNLGMWAAQGKSLEMCKYVASLGVRFDGINDNGQGCLHKAAQRGNEDLCRWLVDTIGLRGVHLRPNASERSTPSQLARFSGHDALADWLERLEREDALSLAAKS